MTSTPEPEPLESGARASGSDPGRGPLILVLGLLGIIACPILGPFAWIMGRKDLGRIKRGEVDLSARPTTLAGMVCGILGTLWFFVVAAGVVVMFAWFVTVSQVEQDFHIDATGPSTAPGGSGFDSDPQVQPEDEFEFLSNPQK